MLAHSWKNLYRAFGMKVKEVGCEEQSAAVKQQHQKKRTDNFMLNLRMLCLLTYDILYSYSFGRSIKIGVVFEPRNSHLVLNPITATTYACACARNQSSPVVGTIV